MRVLVVEDEQDVGDVLLDYLVELGHHAELVRSAEAALGRLQTDRPDAIILDVNLPGMSGIEFLQLRRVRELGVPILAVSGVATESQARECLRLGALDFVGKPVALERLGEVLECVGPHARERRQDDARQRERRRAPRAELVFPVRITEYSGIEWQATSVSLSPYAVKLRPRERVTPGKAVKVTFAPPDGGQPMTVMCVLMREDPSGAIYFFVNLTAPESERLRQLVVRHQASPL